MKYGRLPLTYYNGYTLSYLLLRHIKIILLRTLLRLIISPLAILLFDESQTYTITIFLCEMVTFNTVCTPCFFTENSGQIFQKKGLA